MTRNQLEEDIKQTIWAALLKELKIPPNSVDADDLRENTEYAIERAVILTAQGIFTTINSLKISHVTIGQPGQNYIVKDEDLQKLEESWLNGACDNCHRRFGSTLHRKDGTRLCARCETLQ